VAKSANAPLPAPLIIAGHFPLEPAMTKPTLTVVGKGEPVVADVVAQAEKVAEALVNSAKAGFGYWVMLDGDPPKAQCSANALEMAALAEEIARDMKLEALGLFRE
jgi:hypothetical protein